MRVLPISGVVWFFYPPQSAILTWIKYMQWPQNRPFVTAHRAVVKLCCLATVCSSQSEALSSRSSYDKFASWCASCLDALFLEHSSTFWRVGCLDLLCCWVEDVCQEF